jgi:TetR/AcrR family transcriptional repressor of lmrAB and yxaGH operons
MPPKLVSDTQLMDRLIEVFRNEGFEGASLALLQDASGLKRSSLYHRFPAGKNDMARAAVAEVSARFATDILSAGAEDAPLDSRLQEIGERLTWFFDDGHLQCLLDALSIGEPTQAVAELLNAAMTAWINTFAGLAEEAGHTRIDGLQRATDAVAAIEGALVVARVTGDRAVFERAIGSLPERLIQ